MTQGQKTKALPPPSIDCVVAFNKWHGMPFDADMDIQTEIAFMNWHVAWEAAIASNERSPLSSMAYAIADLEAAAFIECNADRPDALTRVLSANDVALDDYIEQIIEYAIARGIVRRVDKGDHDRIILIVETDE